MLKFRSISSPTENRQKSSHLRGAESYAVAYDVTRATCPANQNNPLEKQKTDPMNTGPKLPNRTGAINVKNKIKLTNTKSDNALTNTLISYFFSTISIFAKRASLMFVIRSLNDKCQHLRFRSKKKRAQLKWKRLALSPWLCLGDLLN